MTEAEMLELVANDAERFADDLLRLADGADSLLEAGIEQETLVRLLAWKAGVNIPTTRRVVQALPQLRECVTKNGKWGG